MFDALLWATLAIAAIGALSAFDGSRDVFHPLIFIAPMFAFLYVWMPFQLSGSGGLLQYFTAEELLWVQVLYLLGVLAFVGGCLSVGCRISSPRRREPALSALSCGRLRIGSFLVGSIGLACWLVSIINVGGFVNAFSRSYAGGWDDSGYVRDGNLLLLVSVLLAVAAIASEGPRIASLLLAGLFGLPWSAQALLMARRGPTFAILVIVGMGWYLNRNRRPPIVAVVVAGVMAGWLALFLVSNRSNIYLGSHFDVNTDVATITKIVDKADTGNEYIYGTGAVVSADRRGHYFWMRRYLAQLLVRPIPSAVWPTKYEDFGVPELLHNAGTGEGFADVLGWEGAVGSAPGIVADLWLELWWLAVPAMALLGWSYGWVWRKAVLHGRAWKCQYAILMALSMYLVMQTMEAVIFRSLLLSVPSWIVWQWALRGSAITAPVRVQLMRKISLSSRYAGHV